MKEKELQNDCMISFALEKNESLAANDVHNVQKDIV